MEEIDTGNIIQDGRRTRGRKIDFSKAAEELPEEDDDDDDDAKDGVAGGGAAEPDELKDDEYFPVAGSIWADRLVFS